MSIYCCRCCDFCNFCEPEEICIDCVIEELHSKLALKGMTFSLIENESKMGNYPTDPREES